MPRPLRDLLDSLAGRGEAVFAIDCHERIIYWNRGCEELLGHSPAEVLGRFCSETLAGRDHRGNLYCWRDCPAAFQAREHPEDPVRPFLLSMKARGGKPREVLVSLFSIPAVRPALSAVGHVLREPDKAPSDLEKRVSKWAGRRPAPLWPLRSEEGEVAQLTPREREILRCMAEGLSTAEIARRLAISPATVRNHVQNIFHKMDLHTKIAAVAFAFQHNLI
jgi:PAS domain S-box-containing protein